MWRTAHLRDQSGFTLVELLIVVGMIGILSVAILATLNPIDQIQKGKDAKRKSDLAQIHRALELYYQDWGRYPPHTFNYSGAVNYQIISTDANDPVKEWGTSWTPYMERLPKDENSQKRYLYYSPDQQLFYLYASLDRGGKDPQVCNGGRACGNVPANTTCGGTNVCNYGVSSLNTAP